MNTLGPWILAGLALVASMGAARAQGIDLSSGGPVEVTARDGFEWHENEQTVIATGDARAVRGTVTVLADRLLARYRKKAVGAAPAATPAASGSPDTSANEVYRLEADGHVRIVTPTDEAVGDHAIYDIDQALLVLTGRHMKLTTPQQVMTARDSMEYWSQKHMAVGRGDAVVVTSDARRLSADILVGYTTVPPATPAAKTPAPGADPAAGAGKLERVEAFGNVEVRTATDTVHGDRGVYVPDSGIARIVGNVRLTHGQNQLNGPAADINMKTGIAHIVSDPAARVQGLIMPNDANLQNTPGATPSTDKAAGGTPATKGTPGK